MAEKPIPTVELIGPVPGEGELFCATCVMLYLGAVSNNPDVQNAAKAKADKIIGNGGLYIEFTLPEAPGRKLRTAITVAPSVYFQMPMPVCWVHVQGYDPERRTSRTQASALIPGKIHGKGF